MPENKDDKKAKPMPRARQVRKSDSLPDRPVLGKELENSKMHDLSHKRDVRCIPVAFQIIKDLAAMPSLPVGSHEALTPETIKATYDTVVYNTMKTLIDQGLLVTDVSYIFSLARQALEFVQTTLDDSINTHMNMVTELIYGLDHGQFDNISVKTLNNVRMRDTALRGAIKAVIDTPLPEADNGKKAKTKA